MKINKFVGPVTRGDVTVAMTEDGKYWDMEAVTEIDAISVTGIPFTGVTLRFEHPVLVLKRER